VAPGRFLAKFDVNLVLFGLWWLLAVFLSNLTSIWLILASGGSWAVFLSNLMSIWLILASGGSWPFSYQI
jgi:hypothetical protein